MNNTLVDIVFWSSVFSFAVGSVILGTIFFNEENK